jgi:DNA-binding transcriptional ArsR family regulator
LLPDYEAEDVLVVSEPAQLRALGGEVRSRIVTHLRERARSTTELAELLGLAKGTVAHHLKTLERAGLVRVVRTRRVRAVTERFYGRTARLFLVESGDSPSGDASAAAVAAGWFRQAAEEVADLPPDADSTATLLHRRLTERDAGRFQRRAERLVRDFRTAHDARGREYTLALGLFPTREER